jgi:hypothetical protein
MCVFKKVNSISVVLAWLQHSPYSCPGSDLPQVGRGGKNSKGVVFEVVTCLAKT